MTIPGLPSRPGSAKPVMDDRKLMALAKKNAAKSGSNSKVPKGFGKKYDQNLPDDPTDEATIKAKEETKKFFSEMKKRDF